jgi:predicted helicase
MPRGGVMRHLLKKENIGLIARRQMPEGEVSYFFITNLLVADGYIRSDNKGGESIFPLYLFSEDGTKAPNLNLTIVASIEEVVGPTSPEDIFDYCYAVLYSPNYRLNYREFLKTNFPRVPYPNNALTFKKLVALGTKLRKLHLMESQLLNNLITTYPIQGSNQVEKKLYSNGKVYINATQYFGDVPEIAWNFHIGGYQPAQKWLKDRKGQVLTNEDIEHYQKIVVALLETDKLMNEIDKVKLYDN